MPKTQTLGDIIKLGDLPIEDKEQIADAILYSAEHVGELYNEVNHVPLDENRTSITFVRSYLPEIDKTSERYKNGLIEGVTPDAESINEAEFSVGVREIGWYYKLTTKSAKHAWSDLKAHCTKIYSGIIGHSSKPVDVYINQHGWVIIANDNEKTLITLYKIDLQVGDEELNKAFIKKSLERINALQEELLAKSIEVDDEKKSLKEKIAANDEQIKELTTQINKLKEQNSAYGDLVKVTDTSLYKAKTDLRDAIENYMVKDAIKVEIDVK